MMLIFCNLCTTAISSYTNSKLFSLQNASETCKGVDRRQQTSKASKLSPPRPRLRPPRSSSSSSSRTALNRHQPQKQQQVDRVPQPILGHRYPNPKYPLLIQSDFVLKTRVQAPRSTSSANSHRVQTEPPPLPSRSGSKRQAAQPSRHHKKTTAASPLPQSLLRRCCPKQGQESTHARGAAEAF